METFRGWLLTEKNGKTYLMSSTRNFIWDSSNMVANCQHGCEIQECLENQHACMCGFYSKKDLKNLLSDYNNFPVYGIIYNYGIVVEGSLGVRAEKAMVIALYVSDLTLSTKLKDTYPDIKFLLPTKEITNVYNRLAKREISPKDWQTKHNTWKQKQIVNQRKIASLKKQYPGGEESENAYVKRRLVNATKEEIIEYAIAYAKDGKWAERRWLVKIENSRKANPGDIIFAANNTTKPFVYIGSTRPFGGQSSIRYAINPYGEIKRLQNIRRWDEESTLKNQREKAIKEWGGLSEH